MAHDSPESGVPMRLLERSPTAPLPGHNRGACLRLRIGADGPIVDLPPGRTTIGSGPRCDIRIQQPGVQPLHCLIVHQHDGVSVRRWGAGSLLNGTPFDESALAPGDCLQVASVELKVIGPPAAAMPETAPQPHREPTEARPAGGELRASRDLARARSRKLLTTLRRVREEHGRELSRQAGDLQKELDSTVAERNALAAELEKTLAEISAYRQAGELPLLVDQQDRLVQDNERLTNEVHALSERIDQQSGELASAIAGRQTLEEENARLCETQRKIVTENAELRTWQDQLSRQVAELGSERDRLGERNEQLGADLKAVNAERAALTDEHAAVHSRCEQLCEQLARLQSDVESLGADKSALANEHAALRQQHEELSRQRDDLKLERDELARRIDTLRADQETLISAQENQEKQQAQLSSERDRLRGELHGLQSQLDLLTAEKASLADQYAALCKKCDELRRRNEQLEVDLRAVAEEKAALTKERAELSGTRDDLRRERDELCRERDQLREQNEQLEAGIAQLDEEIAAVTSAKAAFEEERDWLREENKRFADVERQMRAAQADRENMSAELYRVLLHSAELQKKADQYDALAAANESLLQQSEELNARLAQTEQQVDRLNKEQSDASSIHQSLIDEAAAVRQERQRLAEENEQLAARIDELRQHLEEASRQRAELEERLHQENEALRRELEDVLHQRSQIESRLQESESLSQQVEESTRSLVEREADLQQENVRLREKLADAERVHAELIERMESWERDKAQDGANHDSACRANEDAELRFAEQQQLLAELTESIRDLQQQLAAEREAHGALADDRDAWQRQCVEATLQLSEEEEKVTELEMRLAAIQTESASAADFASSTCRVEDRPTGAMLDESQHATQAEPTRPEIGSARQEEAYQPSALEAPVKEPSPHASSSPFAAPASQTPDQPTSYIERYAHLLEEDAAATADSGQTATAFAPATDASESPSVAIAQQSDVQPAANDAEEESIEQYMAKLLQRTRGQSAGPAAATSPQHSGPLVGSPAFVPPVVAGDDSHTPAGSLGWPDFNAKRSKSATAAPKTDLEALRALANESARRAISRHALRKARRNALTKAIVATLAGMTSLWLILESPDWRSLQCISAAVTLLIAAYWTGQTYAALLQSLRERATDDSEDAANSAVGFQSPLPIDIERS